MSVTQMGELVDLVQGGKVTGTSTRRGSQTPISQCSKQVHPERPFSAISLLRELLISRRRSQRSCRCSPQATTVRR